jgi:hypothetical protein
VSPSPKRNLLLKTKGILLLKPRRRVSPSPKRNLLLKTKGILLRKSTTKRSLTPKRKPMTPPRKQRQRAAKINLMLSRPRNRLPQQKTPDGELNHESIFTQT